MGKINTTGIGNKNRVRFQEIAVETLSTGIRILSGVFSESSVNKLKLRFYFQIEVILHDNGLEKSNNKKNDHGNQRKRTRATNSQVGRTRFLTCSNSIEVS